MLNTPLGQIEIKIDNVSVPYEYIKLDENFWKVDGHYQINIEFSPDGNEHSIDCIIKSYKGSDDDFVETGERLELKSFINNNVKLSLGMEGDTLYDGDERLSEYDYDNDYLSNGVRYCVLPFTKTKIYRFGIAWLINFTEENETNTWFAAEPLTSI